MLKGEGIVIVLSGVGNGERLRNRLMADRHGVHGDIWLISVYLAYMAVNSSVIL
jgi:hypothetical protein